ncbi:hypothetical protein [Rufibacter quisquiliarum]|uniref:Uncharacterized protein n=1 Tax=Rufibacter quisquiliarum TaxID=1549639 RepID=A0A839GG77_9BACT|nr:hypothetical protein [Rufibacter quisquiliarum]MBA9078664.1 hypothetical protein [Rufibacter quisquiliarum]
MKVKCGKCGIELTEELESLDDTTLLNETDEQSYVPIGKLFISDGEYYTGTEGKIIINCADLKNAKNHPDIIRLQGCCGLDGLNGNNKVCINGHEVGTEKSDCWIAHGVILEREFVVIEK